VPPVLTETGLPEIPPVGPPHENVTPATAEDPFNNALVSEQVMVSMDVEAETFGVVVFAITTIEEEELHPVNNSVTVTMYTPESVTMGLMFVEENPLGPVQEKFTPGVVELAVMVTEGLEQVMVCDEAALTLGSPDPVNTLTLSVDVHPVLGLVTVTV
jgi:hypothetical protein